MYDLLKSEEFTKLETEFPFLRRAREHCSGLKSLDYVVVDIETTGLEPAPNEIIEIAALRIAKGEVADVFNFLIRIDHPLPPEIVKLTGITDEMLRDGEEKGKTLKAFIGFVKDTPLVAHNVDFDLPFLKHHLSLSIGENLPNPAICTLKLSRSLLSGLPAYKLQKVAEHLKIPTPVLHRAMGDVEITYQVWMRLIEALDKKGVLTLEALLKGL